MAIIGGYRVSGLSTPGLPGGILGLLYRSPMIPLVFELPVAGPVTADMECTPQSCQEANDGIQLVVVVVDQAGDPINLRQATAKQLLLRAPSGTSEAFDASFLTNGIDGALAYEADAADLDETGTYQLQAKYTIDGKTQSTRWGRFRVGPNIEE